MAERSVAEVEVLGLTEDVDDDFLLLYFENKRRSGGGAIQSLARNGSVALITFSDPKDAEGVLLKGEHRLQHQTVQVRRPPPWDPRKVALCGLDPNTAETLLELYVETVSGRDFSRIIRSADKSSALICFKEELSEQDLHLLLNRVEVKKLHKRLICARRVRACSDILVENIGSQISADLLEMYFESKRSGGGAVRSITMLRNNSAAIVSFHDWNVADQVLGRQHTLHNCQLSVSRYDPDLLGNPNGDINQEREMEEEDPTMTPNTLNLLQNSSQVIGIPAKDHEELCGKDEKMVGMELCDMMEQNQSYEAPEVPQMRPEEPQMRPEVPQMGSQSTPEVPPIRLPTQALASTVNRPHELDTLRTLYSPDKDPDWGHFLDPLIAPASYNEGEVPAGEASSSVHEAEVLMEAAELSFMQKYHHELLAGMDAVTIFPLDEKDRVGFKVIGNPFSCKTAVELLQHVVSLLSSHTITLEYPWVSHFLLESEGQRTLRDIEKHHQCIIDTSQISWKVLDCVYIDPWSFIYDSPTDVSPVLPMITDDDLVPENPLLQADMEGIKMFASLLKSEQKSDDLITGGSSATLNIEHGEVSLEDLYTSGSSKEDDSETIEVKDEVLNQVCEMSRKEYQARELDEEAHLLLAIQRSMDHQVISEQEEEEELQRALEMSLLQHQRDNTEDSLQRALEMSLQDQKAHDNLEPMSMFEDPASFSETEATSGLAQVRVLAGDETSIVVAGTALRKAITSKLNTVSLEAPDGVQNVSQILDALEKKHKVHITKNGRELQIQGFLHGPGQCRHEISEILNALQAKVDVMEVDIEKDVEIIDVPETSEEYQRVVQPFLNTLQELKLSIDVVQVQKVHNPLLYDQYRLKKLRMVMTDPNKPAERILYHGTTETGAKEICHSGFNRSFCGKNATLYGQGVYFAVESEMSARYHYSPPNKEGMKFVFVARVLTGEYVLGKEDMRTPPIIPNAHRDVPRRYDSVVNSMTNPSVFVIFNDTQAYPEYLITCRKCREPTK